MTYMQRVFQGTLITLISNFLVGVIGYFLKVYLARSFSVEEFGLIFAVISFFNVFMVFYNFGLENALVRYIPEFKVSGNISSIKKIFFTCLLFQFMLAGLLGIIIYLFSGYFSLLLFKEPLSKALILAGLVYFLLSPLNLFEAFLRGLQKIKLLSIYTFAKNLFMLACAFVLYNSLSSQHKINLMIYSYNLFYLLLLVGILSYFIIKKQNPFSYWDTGIFKMTLEFSLPIFSVSLFTSLFNRMDELFITYFSSLTEVGYYNVADSTISAALTILGAFTMIYVPVVAEMWAKKDKKILEFSVANITKYLLIISIPACLAIMFYAKEITTILFGEKFFGAYLVLIVYAPAILLVPLTKVFVPVLLSANETKYIAKISIICFLLDFIGNILLVPFYGAVGAQLSSIAGMILLFILVYIKVRKLINIPIKVKEPGMILVSSILFIFCVYGFNNVIKIATIYQIIICLALSGIIYISLLFGIKVISIPEIESIIKLRKNID